MGLLLIFTFLISFNFLLYGQNEVLLLSVITGIAVILSLITIHIKVWKYSVKKALISLILGTVISILFFLVFLFIFGGPAYFENQPASYDYRISVLGLSNYNGSLVTDIIVPIPMRNGTQIFTDQEMQYQSFGDWTSMLVMTKQGKMLAFQTRNENLTDINARFRKDLNYSIDVKDIMQDALLYPATSDVTLNYTIWIYGDKNVQNYATYIYIDQNIQPIVSDNNSITFNLGFTVRNGVVHGRARNTYRVDVFEAIPENVNGPIPVKAQLATVGETGWGPLRPDVRTS